MVMNDCDKTLLVMYMPISCGLKTIINAQEDLRSYFDETVKPIVVPSYNNDSNPKIEVVNPRYVSKKEYKALVNKVNKYLDEINNKKTEQ